MFFAPTPPEFYRWERRHQVSHVCEMHTRKALQYAVLTELTYAPHDNFPDRDHETKLRKEELAAILLELKELRRKA